jgi:hypothetical protein
MTNSSRNILLCILAVLSPAVGLAQTQPVKPAAAPAPTPAPRARPVVTAPTPNQQWQRQVDRQQLRTQQQQNALRENLRQGNLDQQRNTTTNPALRGQLDNADQSQQQMYRARQDDATRRYQATPAAGDPARTTPRPATAGSAGR